MKEMSRAGRTFRTIKEVSGPLLFVESVTDVGYGELVEITTPKWRGANRTSHRR